MKTVASILLLATSATEAFVPSSTSAAPSTTATATTNSLLCLAGHVNTRHRIEDQELGIWSQSCRDPHDANSYVPCDAISGHDVRHSWTSYAPPHGSPPTYGAVGCPGGGDWCYPGGIGAAKALPPTSDARKRAAIVVAALAGLGKGTGGARELGSGSIPRLSSSGGISMAGLLALPSSSSSSSSGGGGSVMGEDVRESRGSFAPYYHDGRVGAFGEIGASGVGVVGGGGGGGETRMALPRSSSSSSSSTMKSKSSGRPKAYGLGSWKK